MDDLISRQAAIDALEITDWYHQDKDLKMVHGANSAEHQAWYKAEDVYKAINSVPSAERKKGRWLPYNLCGDGYWVCSSCKNPTEAFAADVLYKYCPVCGAEMREGRT